jgi:RimJ/RimL family protein N-acetyltransferase
VSAVASLEFVSVDGSAFRAYQSWFVDEELPRRISPPAPEWLEYVCLTSGVHAWMVREKGRPVGQVQLDVDDDGAGYVAVVVEPDLRGRGYGTRILRDLLARPEARSAARLEAGIEANNVASRRLAESAGFAAQDSRPDRDGFLHYVYITSRAACSRRST